jgi:hypothetical protein
MFEPMHSEHRLSHWNTTTKTKLEIPQLWRKELLLVVKHSNYRFRLGSE